MINFIRKSTELRKETSSLKTKGKSVLVELLNKGFFKLRKED